MLSRYDTIQEHDIQTDTVSQTECILRASIAAIKVFDAFVHFSQPLSRVSAFFILNYYASSAA